MNYRGGSSGWPSVPRADRLVLSFRTTRSWAPRITYCRWLKGMAAAAVLLNNPFFMLISDLVVSKSAEPFRIETAFHNECGTHVH
ncbi:hypothetical protein [Spirosoma horti]